MFSNVKLASVPMMHRYKNLQHHFSPFQLSPEYGTRYVKPLLHKISVTALTLIKKTGWNGSHWSTATNRQRK